MDLIGSEEIAGISEMKEKFNTSLKEVMSLVANKGDIATAISKLCSVIQSTHEMMHNIYEVSQQNLLKLLAVQKDIELSNLRRDILIKTNSCKIVSIETKMACISDMNRVWITFACDKELNEFGNTSPLYDIQ